MLLCFANAACGGEARDEFREIRDLLLQSHHKQAADKLDTLVQRSDLSPQERFNAGWLYGQAHQFQKALAIFRSVPETVPDRVTHAYAAALAAVELRDFETAVQLLAPLIDEPGFGSNQTNLLGVAYTKIGQLQRAYSLFQKLIEGQPSDPTAYFNMSTLLCEGGKSAECLAGASRTASQFPSSAQAHLILGAAEIENGQADRSRKEFATAHALDTNSTEAIFFVALADYRDRNYAPAIALLRESTSTGLRDPDLFYLLAECIVQQRELPEGEALRALDQAIAISPESVPARALRGKLRLNKREYAAAASDLEIALKNDPKSRTAIYLLAKTYQWLGRIEEARALRTRLASTSGDMVEALSGDRVNSLLSRAAAK